MSEPKVTIVIPVKKINDYIRESMKYIPKLDYDNYEVLILPDNTEDVKFPKTRIIATGPVGPAEKRDLALEHSDGEIIAFLDDDAYPRADWLKNAIGHFENKEVAAVGGPAVTPDSDSTSQKASGLVFASLLGGGRINYRYIPKKLQEVDDFPSVNLLVRRSIMKEIGGFDSHYWPGEDTKFCLDIINKKKKIIYDPEVFVWHHRRNLFGPHLKQVWRYAIHRGFFVRKLPETSLRPTYFIPTAFVIVLCSGATLSFFSPAIKLLWLSLMSIYLIALLITAISTKRLGLAILVPLGIITTHITYGIGFVRGLIAKDLLR